jgi:hypothetical protein
VLVFFVNLVIQPIFALAGALALVGFVITIIFAVYLPFILIGVWRSAGRYRGKRIWSVLARLVAACCLVVFMLVLIPILALIVADLPS